MSPGERLTPFDFVFFGGRVNVTWVTFVKTRFPFSFLKSINHTGFIFNVLIALNEDI